MENYYDGKEVMVTGGAGFVGSHLVTALHERGAHVTVIDNCSRGAKGNLEELGDAIKFVEWDLDMEAPNFFKADLVFDLAAVVFGVRHLYEEGADILTTNLRITQNVLEAAVSFYVKRLIYVSSSCVYDFEGVSVPHVESDVRFPESSYGQSKYIGEVLCHAYAEQHGIDIRMARLFNVYGPGDSGNSPHVIPDFMRKAHAIKVAKDAGQAPGPFVMIGDGEQTRSFCYVDDIVDGLLSLGGTPQGGPHVYNIGTEDAVCMNVLASKIMKMYGIAKWPTQGVTAPSMDVRERSADITLAKTFLEWEPKVDLETGLARTREWLQPKIDDMAWRL